MKALLFSTLIFLFSCSEKEQKKSVEIPNPATPKETLNKQKSADSVYKKWLYYYVSNDPKFRQDARKFLGETNFDEEKDGGILGEFDADFDRIYKPFLIYNPSKTKYLDFDSYSWFVADDGIASFEVDQELNLVDLKTKKIKRLAFYGPSFWIEDAYWKNDSVFVTLENSYDRVLFMNEYNLQSKKKKSYQFLDTLNFKSKYTAKRLENHGIKSE